MKFEIKRTSLMASLLRSDEKPCEEAIPENEEGAGPNWIINFDTIDELVKFSQKYGEIIINTKWENVLEIYDDYRE